MASNYRVKLWTLEENPEAYRAALILFEHIYTPKYFDEMGKYEVALACALKMCLSRRK